MKQNIIMEVLRKANFHSVDICRLIKNQSYKKDQGEKLIQTFFLNFQVAHEVLRRMNVVHITEFSLH